MPEIPKKLINDIKNHRLKVQELLSNPSNPIEKKKYLSSMGIYEEKNTNTYMIRVRNVAGIVTIRELKEISKLADLYAEGQIHFTTRQDIQFHRVTLENTADIAEKLLEIGLLTRGSGGNGVRNIACSPLSGIEANEVFDVTEYALKTMDYLLEDDDSFCLPRKYKIAFSNSLKDTAYAKVSDLGFIAKIKDGIKGFEVYGAGGLGKNPALAIKLKDFIPANNVFYYVFAMKDLFFTEGDRTNRNKARIRYILFKLGKEKFIDLFNQYLEKTKKKYTFDNIANDVAQANSASQAELTYVYVQPENGFLKTVFLNKIINFIENLDYKVSIRLTSTQGFFIRDLKLSDAKHLSKITSEFTSYYDIDNSIACVGASICKIGICKSQELLKAVKETFKDVEPDIKKQLPQLFISGCANSCARHQISKIGFYGKIQRTKDGFVHSYEISLGGNIENDTKLGESFGEISAKKIPYFLLKLAHLKYHRKIDNFYDFVKSEKHNIQTIIDDFKQIDIEDINPNLFKQEIFK